MSKTPQLYVRQDIGTGNPVVLLHGMFGDGSQWDTISKLLINDYRVIVVDLYGHGKSPRPKNAQYTDKEHVQALRNTLEALKATENTTVVGYSMGGAVALAYSSTYPDSVEQVYLISTPFYLKPEEMISNKYAGSVLFSKISTGLFSLVQKVMHPGNNAANAFVTMGNTSAKFHAMIGANDNVLDADIIRLNIKNLINEFDFVGHLKKLKDPLTFFAGKKDMLVAQTQLNALRQFHPYMDIQRLDVIKIDHMLVQNLPREISGLIKKNLRKELHVETDEGKGTPIVLIHGIEGSSHYWDSYVKPLAEYNRVITIDLLGFGKSPKPLNIPYSLDDQVRHLEITLQKLNIKKFDIIAHSLGSLVSLAYAAKHPESVTSLTLLAPVFVTEDADSTNHIIKRLHLVEKISDGSDIYSSTAQALGYKRMSKYLPSLRTLSNSIRNQKAIDLAKRVKDIPVKIIYGNRDLLIDTLFLTKVAEHFKKVEVIEFDGQGHNFALSKPVETLQYIFPEKTFSTKPARAPIIPPTFAQQLVKLAIPVLFLKSAAYLTAGILLFTQLAPVVITLGVAGYFFYFGYAYIQGAFSLKNEKYSYFWYILLGLGIIIFGLFVILNPRYALEISTLVVCGLVLLSGITRLIVAMLWTTKKSLKNRLFFTGSLMTIAGSLSLAGGLISIHLIVYTIAILLIARGAQFAGYVIMALIFAYVRGFGR
ncbi:MAG: alpha/beta fold hydrolase [Patescibacteria group bacterium]